MSRVALKAIELEVVLCQMRNPEVTEVDAYNKDFDDQDAIKIGECLRYLVHFVFNACDKESPFPRDLCVALQKRVRVWYWCWLCVRLIFFFWMNVRSHATPPDFLD
jgi:hypothetical protein